MDGKKSSFKSEMICICCVKRSAMLFARPLLCHLPSSLPKTCSKSRKCSKSDSHVGKCDNKRRHSRFWEKSPFFKLKKAQGDLSSAIEEVERTRVDNHLAKEELLDKEKQLDLRVVEVEETVSTASTYFV